MGFVARAVLILLKGQRYHFADTLEYDAAARALLAGHGWGASLPRAPLYPALLALAYRIAGVGNFAAARWVQLPIGLALIPLIGLLGARIRAPRAGELAMFGVALAPTLVYTSTMLYPNALYTLLLLGATLCAHALAEGAGFAVAAGLGATLALIVFTDPIGAVPALVLLPWVIVASARRRAAVRHVLVAMLVAAVLLGPWLARPHAAGGAGFVAKAEYVVWVARHAPAIVGGHTVHDPADSVFQVRPATAFVRHELALVRTQPGAYLHDVAFEFAHFFAPVPDRLQTSNVYTSGPARTAVLVYMLPLLVLAALGALIGAARGRDRWLLALLPLATAATYAFFFTQMRYRVPVEPQLLLLAALAVVQLARMRAQRRAPHAVPGAASPVGG